MKNKLTKIVIILFSMAFALRVTTIMLADVFTGTDLAIKLDSTNADLYYERYGSVDLQPKLRLQALKRCINLTPSWPAYHLYYGLMLEKMSPNPNPLTKGLILSELEKASDLKPSSRLYRKILQEHR